MAAALMRPWHAVRRVWQRSIQLRVISATLALSLVVAILLGATLMRQITDGLLRAQADSAVAEASAGIDSAQELLDHATDDGTGSWVPMLRQIAEDSAGRGSGNGTDALYEIVLLGPGENPVTFASEAIELEWVPEIIPQELREHVTGEARVFHTYTAIPGENGSLDNQDGSLPVLAVGGQVTDPSGAQYEMYYLFPLTEEQETIGLVRTALITAGLLLVLLLGALAWLVTRQVVTPVRMAARIAERFSAGKLSERMAVRGSDDLALLATSFNQMAASLQHQIGQLEELSRVQQRFVSDVSHELRTPLTTVRMAADVLYESKDEYDPVVRRSAELLQAQLDRFEALLNDLLEISRFDAGAAILNAGRHDMRDLVHSVVDGAQPLAERKGSQIIVDVPTYPCVVEIDARRIERIVRNLVANGIEHGEGRDVVVRMAADDDAVSVAIRDYGVGLKPGESSLVFHRFWRADRARARTTGGTGLGLAIALEDARLHGGWLQAWGEPGEGSQFRLTLPRRAGADITSAPLALVPEDARGRALEAANVGAPYRQLPQLPPAESPAQDEPDVVAGEAGETTPVSSADGESAGDTAANTENAPEGAPGTDPDVSSRGDASTDASTVSGEASQESTGEEPADEAAGDDPQDGGSGTDRSAEVTRG
ncbi:HAMP domain-containing protein [Actinobacteria bacterium YIM 96077]|uniref:Sensor histidine kinase MtrB n=1 Tax=Phytoactinopolyspora halophila TaxID=1981511 RepID=A0A329R2V5_9ACTN|nr:MtrAB system histidine kinase MtrB [Phytoactinopolyspora halophila]AYY12063.1 HAMP domain-containing protein [Actinobacteria bacterium YIM 96077]RAW18703.1 two-component sensor histidine kinase [Phytoactinopolyspora halophila]